MTRTRLALWGVLGSLVLVSLWFRPEPPSPAWAQGVGIFARATCSTANLTNAVAGQTWCFDQTARVLTVYDGSTFVVVTASLTGANFAAVGGQTNFGNVIYIPLATGTTQQVALGAQIQSATNPTTNTGRIALYGGIQNGVSTDDLFGLNLVCQQNAGYKTFINCLEVGFNNLRGNDVLNPTDKNHYGMTLDVYGGFSTGPAALAIRQGNASSTWQRGLWIPSPSITNGGYAIDYEGDGSGRVFRVNSAADATANTLNAASATYSNGVAVIVASGTTSNLTNIRGLSASSSKSNNLRGTCTFSAAATCAVAFANNEPDSNYFILVGGIVNVSAKAVSGFTMTATGTNSNAVDWMLVR